MKLFTPVLFSLLWLLPALTLAFPCSRDNVSSAECQALIDFYDDTHGDDWQQNDNWLSGDVNQWHGVELRDDQVISLNLPENNLVGCYLIIMYLTRNNAELIHFIPKLRPSTFRFR